MAANEAGQLVKPRSPLSWIAIGLRLLAAVLFSIALAHRAGLWWLLAVIAVGLFLVPFAWRRKAAPVAGAIWNASADLIEGGKHAPGELSFTPEAVVWVPSSYSLRHGYEEFVLPLTPRAKIELQSGPALLDVFVDVRGPGREARFLTHRSPRLRQAVRQIAV